MTRSDVELVHSRAVKAVCVLLLVEGVLGDLGYGCRPLALQCKTWESARSGFQALGLRLRVCALKKKRNSKLEHSYDKP